VDREVFDPESAGESFEPLARPGLLAGLGLSLGFRSEALTDGASLAAPKLGP
jgi:hypothetical protein